MDNKDIAAKVAELIYYPNQTTDDDTQFAVQLLVEHFCVPAEVEYYDLEELERYILEGLEGTK